MERFKACEKEMKTKAFSKEGLSAQQKLDPKEVAKSEMVQWISGMVDELSQQIERTEAEVETLRGATKKKKSTADGRTSELEALNDRRRWHISKLELIMRLLENGNLATDSVSTIKDDIQYYVESNTEEDFTEDDDLYETLNLAEEEDHYGMHDDLQSSHDTASNIEEASSTPSKPEPVPAAAARRAAKPSPGVANEDALAGDKSPTKEKVQPAAVRGPGVRKPTLDSTTARPMIPASRAPAPQPAAANGPTPRSVPPTMPTLRYASAAAAAAAPVAPPSATVPPSASVKSPTGPAAAASIPSTAAIVPPTPATNASSITSPPVKDAAPSPETKKSSLPAPPPGLADHLPAKPTTEPPVAEPPQPTPAAPPQQAPEPTQPVQQRSTTPALSDITSAQATSRTGSISLDPNAAGAAVAGALAQQTGVPSAGLPTQTPGTINQGLPSAPGNPAAPSSAEQDTRLPSSLADLVGTFESLKTREPDVHRTADALEAGFGSMPEVEDAEKPTHYYVPKHPWTGTPAYYPREPAGWNRETGMWGLCEVDVLFYVFYYLPGGYMQCAFLLTSQDTAY